MHSIFVIHKTAFSHSNLNSSNLRNLKPKAVILFFFLEPLPLFLESLAYNKYKTKHQFYKTKASIVAITCNSKERVHHMVITSTNPIGPFIRGKIKRVLHKTRLK